MIYSILLGVVIFWLTSKIMDVKGWGLIMNTLFVIGGSIVGNIIFGNVLGHGFAASTVSGVVGCCLVLLIIRATKK